MHDPESFSWWGQRLEYERGEYNNARRNERAVEIPIAQDFVWVAPGPVLEVGNVLEHYDEQVTRTVVDRYEQARGVRNLDVFDIRGPWATIVSVSTIEHVRHDEPADDGRTAADAIAHLRGLLSADGRMLITFALGHNLELDDHALHDDLGCSRSCTLVRDANHGWVQTIEPEWRPYGIGQPWANAVWVGEWGTPRNVTR